MLCSQVRKTSKICQEMRTEKGFKWGKGLSCQPSEKLSVLSACVAELGTEEEVELETKI